MEQTVGQEGRPGLQANGPTTGIGQHSSTKTQPAKATYWAHVRFVGSEEMGIWTRHTSCTDALEQLLQPLLLAREAWRVSVHKERAVRVHARQKQCFLKSQQIHFRDVLLAYNGAHDLHLGRFDFGLLLRRRNPYDFCRARGQVLHHCASRAPQQYRLEPLPQQVEVSVPPPGDSYRVVAGKRTTASLGGNNIIEDRQRS